MNQDMRRFAFEVGEKQLRVVDFSAREEISAPFEVELTLALAVDEEEINFEDVIGQPGLLTIFGIHTDSVRYFHGILNRFWKTGSSGRFLLYRASLVPALWRLSLEQDCRIFQDMNIEEIVGAVMKDAGITSDRYKFRLQGASEKRTYCVQYRESDFDFVSRLCEEEGIFYFFEHDDTKHLLVFGNSAAAYNPIAGDQNSGKQDEIAFKPETSMAATRECVQTISLSRQITPGKVSLNDYNFLKPSTSLLSVKQVDKDPFENIEQYDYPGEYADNERGKSLAAIRLEEARAFLESAEGQSDCPRFVPGFTFKLTEHDLSSFEQEYLLTGVTHFGAQPQVLEEQAGEAGFSYSNQFVGIPSAVVCRPRRKTPKPVVRGIQTAFVIGPAGEEIYTDADGYGRVKVRFHWDRSDEKDEKRSCWVRVGQFWAGAGWGGKFIPRIGQEVIVDFLEGDPDRPLVTGCVYNGAAKPPYAKAEEATKSTVKSNSSPGGDGFNEIRFEDKAGEEEIFIHAQKNIDLRVNADQRQWIGQDAHRIVVANQLEKVEEDKHLTVEGDQNEKIGKTFSLTVGGDLQEKVDKDHALDAGGDIHLKAGANIVIEAGSKLTLKVGGSFVVLDASGVTVKGSQIKLNSGGSAGSGKGCSPETPEAPQEAGTAETGEKTFVPALAARPSPQAKAQQTAMKDAAKSGTPFCDT